MAGDNKKILIMTSTFPRWVDDDQPRFVLDLCKCSNKNFKIFVLAPHCAGAKTEEKIEGVRVFRFRYAPQRYETLTYGSGILGQLRQNKWRYLLLPFFFASMFLYAFILLIKYKFKIIHAHWIVPQGLVAALLKSVPGLRRVKLIITSHGSDLYSLDGPLLNGIKCWALKKSDRITVVSDNMRKSIESISENLKDRIDVAPMGTDLRKSFRPLPNVQRDRSASLLFVGRLVENKGLIYLLKALPAIIESWPDVNLTIVGDGPLKDDLESYVKDAGLSSYVIFKGKVKHRLLPDYYCRAHAAIFPFLGEENDAKEGFGLVVVEAQGCCCPIISTDVPALEDTVFGEQRYWLCSQLHPEVLSNKVCELLSDTWENKESRAQAAREYVIKYFDWQSIGSQYIEIYNECLS